MDSQLPPSTQPSGPKRSRSGLLLFLGCGAFVFLAFAGTAIAVMAGSANMGVDDTTVLKMTLGGAVPERVRKDGLAELFGDVPMTVLDHRTNLRKAAADKRIKGVVLKLEPLMVGWAKVEELRQALLEFKKSGKFVIAYAEMLGEQEYALALAADEILMPPDAPFEFNGLASDISHYPGLLEKLGIEVQYFRYGKYKSVSGESMGRKALTEPVKEMINENLDTVFAHFVEAVAERRQLEPAAVKALIDEGGLKSSWALEKKLIDGLVYWDEVETKVKSRLNVDADDEVKYLTSKRYRGVSASSAGLKEGKRSIGLVYSTGLIVAGSGGLDPFSGDDAQGSTPIIKALRRGVEDDDIAAIVMRVDSPGGAGLGCDYVRREVEKARVKKPVIVSMSDVAASGGYWVSMDATAIVAQPTTATGSIGIFSVVPSLKGTYEKLGLNNEVFTRGAHADSLMGARPMTEPEAAAFDRDLLASYQRFVELAAKGRHKTVEELEQVAQGRTWYGSKALELGLVDKLGGYDVAFALAKEKANIPVDELVKVVPLERSRTLLEQLTDPEGDEDDELGSQVLARLVEASGLRPLLKRVPGLGVFVREVVVGRQTQFPLMEHSLQTR